MSQIHGICHHDEVLDSHILFKICSSALPDLFMYIYIYMYVFILCNAMIMPVGCFFVVFYI